MARGNIIYLSQGDIVKRALASVGQPIKYHLSYPNGGTDPTAEHCADPDTMQADCIGFAAWASGFDRLQARVMTPDAFKARYPAAPVRFPTVFPLYDGYINTDSMIDSLSGQTDPAGVKITPWFNEFPGIIDVGSMIVAHTYRKKLPPFSSVIGHIGIITAVHKRPVTTPDDIEVVHCSPSNYRYTDSQSAIWKTNAAIWFNYYPRYHVVTLNPARRPPAPTVTV